MAKQSSLTPEQKEQYLERCDSSLDTLFLKVDRFVQNTFDESDLIELYRQRRDLLTKDFNETLAVVQFPKESSDYSQEHLRQWREQVRRLDPVLTLFFKEFYLK